MPYKDRAAFGKGFEDARYKKNCNPFSFGALLWTQYEAGQEAFKSQGAEYAENGPSMLRKK